MMGEDKARRCRRQAGFTLSQVVSGLLVFSVVGAAITSVLVGTFRSTGFQSRVADAQLDVTTGMALLQDDLRAAGYDPLGNPATNLPGGLMLQQVVSGTTSDSIQFIGDVDGDNLYESLTYAVVSSGAGNTCPAASSPCLMRTEDQWNGAAWTLGTAQPVAGNVTTFTLQFYCVNPCNPGPAATPAVAPALETAAQVLAAPQRKVTFITVTLSGTGTYRGKTANRTLTSDVALRQSNVLPLCGQYTC
jgi:type II secretory pathway component PulJ